MNNFGEKLKAARLAAGLKQDELAACIGTITGNSISNWERGTSRPDSDTVAKICTILHISADTLLGVQTDRFEVTPIEMIKIKQYRSLDDHGQKIVDVVLQTEIERIDSLYSKKRDAPS